MPVASIVALPGVGARLVSVAWCFETPLPIVLDIFNRFRKKIVWYKENLMDEASQSREI